MSAGRGLVTAAGVVYGSTALLGVALATGVWRNQRHRWIHHAGYIAAVALTASAVAVDLRGDRARAGLAAIAIVPLAALPRIPTRGRRHPIVALVAAPWLAAAIARHP